MNVHEEVGNYIEYDKSSKVLFPKFILGSQNESYDILNWKTTDNRLTVIFCAAMHDVLHGIHSIVKFASIWNWTT